jgi:hypothetical protein
MRNISDKSVATIKTHFIYSITFPENRAVYEIMMKNTVEPVRPRRQHGA